MKKIILLSLLTSISFFTFAQFPVTLSYNDNDVTNQTLALEEEMFVTTTNPSSEAINVTVEVSEIEVPTGSEVSVCWSKCFTVTSPMIIGTQPVEAGASLEGWAGLVIHYNANGSTEPASVKLKIYEDGNPNDYINLNLEKASDVNQISENQDFVMFPNPATDRFSVKLESNLAKPELKILNIIGKTVLRTKISNKLSTVDVSRFPSGVYFVSILSNDTEIKTKKLVIK